MLLGYGPRVEFLLRQLEYLNVTGGNPVETGE
jgi:hypothetical protein